MNEQIYALEKMSYSMAKAAEAAGLDHLLYDLVAGYNAQWADPRLVALSKTMPPGNAHTGRVEWFATNAGELATHETAFPGADRRNRVIDGAKAKYVIDAGLGAHVDRYDGTVDCIAFVDIRITRLFTKACHARVKYDDLTDWLRENAGDLAAG